MKYIIFDFDGTLADTFKLFVDIAHNLTGHMDLLDAAIVAELRHDSLMEVSEKLGLAKHRWPWLLMRGRKQMAKRVDEIKPFQGIDEVLKGLHGQGVKMYIMSTNSKANINSFLAKNGFSNYFTGVYGGVGLLNKSAALAKILKKNGLKPEDAVYVGDEARDVVAAKAVNIPVVAVSWGFNDVDRLAKENPMVIVRSCPQLLKVLESWEVS